VRVALRGGSAADVGGSPRLSGPRPLVVLVSVAGGIDGGLRKAGRQEGLEGWVAAKRNPASSCVGDRHAALRWAGLKGL
jgi:hypothetical protein